MASKTFLVASTGCGCLPSLPDCHYLSSSAFVFITSFSPPVCRSIPLWIILPASPRWHICVSMVSQLHHRSSYCYYKFKKNKKQKKKAARCHFLSVVVQRRLPRLIWVLVFGPFVLSHPVSSQAKHEHTNASQLQDVILEFVLTNRDMLYRWKFVKEVSHHPSLGLGNRATRIPWYNWKTPL